MTYTRVGRDDRERGFLTQLAKAVSKSSISLSDAARSLVGRRRAERARMVSLIEMLVDSDEELRLVSASVSSLLRSSLAAEGVRAALNKEPAIVEDTDALLTPDDVLRIARVEGEAEASILSHEMLEPSTLAHLLGSSSANPREFVRAVRMRGNVVGLPRPGGFVFPAFQVNRRRRELWPIVTELNRQLGAKEDPWAVASWWFTPDSRLGAEPRQLVSDPSRADELRRAAARELASID